MADLKVEVLEIEKIINHPNADRLDLATVLGYQVVVGRNQYKLGDRAVYFPVDSLLPMSLQDFIFAGSKVKLNKNRVRAARIRGAMSFGLMISLEQANDYHKEATGCQLLGDLSKVQAGLDLTKLLEVTKYEPPSVGGKYRGIKVPPRYRHPDFYKYTDIQQGKKNFKAIRDGNFVMALTEKVHGRNFRCGWVPFHPTTFFQRMLKKLTEWTVWQFVPEYEFVYGSHNVQLQDDIPVSAQDNVYKRAVDMHNLKDRIDFGEVWYFEIYGPGVQNNYGYGLEDGTIDVAVIDIRYGKDFHPWYWVRKMCKYRGLKCAPTMAIYFDGNNAIKNIDRSINSPDGKAVRSALDFKTPVEGAVLRPYFKDEITYAGRFVFKFISDEYLLNRDNSDHH